MSPPPSSRPSEAREQVDGSWVLTRYGDARMSLHDPRFSANPLPLEPPVAAQWLEARVSPASAVLRSDAVDRLRGHWWVFTDAPQHTRLRKIIKPLFDARVRRLHAGIERVVGEILARRAGARSMVVADDLAMALPAAVTADLLGLQGESTARFESWLLEPDTIFGVHSQPSPEGIARAEDILAYFGEVIAARRRAPGDDLVSDLCQAQASDAPISDDELLASTALLLIAGISTLHNFFVSAVASLVRTPDAMARLRQNPELLSPLAEETLRTCQILPRVRRRALEDVRLGAKTIPRGALVLVDLNLANHDPVAFADPMRFDMSRDPNPHLSFGIGTHHCLGAALARMQTEALLLHLAQQAPGLMAADEASRDLVREFACPKGLRVRW